ncbi:MAG: DUF637 domain-containing protein, partial [Endozoicomonas sp.]|uniref:DUF637 domain-containing protein n=1 Tax=Endozoicomonas sp. TaxID=1892382 RepID=UPI003D9AC108
MLRILHFVVGFLICLSLTIFSSQSQGADRTEQILERFEREFLQYYDSPQDLGSWQERLRFLEEDLIPLSPKLKEDWVVEGFVSECRESIRELQLKQQASSQVPTFDVPFEERTLVGEYDYVCEHSNELRPLPGGVMALDLYPGDAQGVSHYCLSVESISKAGLILNNQVSATSDVPGLQPNEALGRHPVKTIVLHINNQSTLYWEGLIQVAGQPARVVLSTQRRLICDGCGSVNVNALDIQVDGPLYILERGIRPDHSLKKISLRAETIHLNSTLVAPDLRIILTGAGSVLTGTGKLIADSFTLNAPNGWVDWPHLIQTRQGDLFVKARDNLNLSQLQSAQELNLRSGGTAILSHAYAGGKLSIIAAEGIELKGPITSIGPLVMDAPSVTQEGEVHALHKPCPMDLNTESWTHRGQLYMSGTPWLDVERLNNQGGLIDCQGNITLSLSEWDNQHGTLAGHWLHFSVFKNLNSNNGRIEASQGLTVNVRNQLLLQNGHLLTNSSIPVRMTTRGRHDNRHAVISVQAPELIITTPYFDNTDGLVEHQGDFVMVDAEQLKNNKGRLNTSGKLRLLLQELALGKHDNLIGERHLSLVVKHWVRVTTHFKAPGEFSVQASTMEIGQSGEIHSQGSMSLRILNDMENRGSIRSEDDLSIEAVEVINFNRITSNRELTINAGLTKNQPGAVIASGGNQWLSTRLDNTEATVFSGKDLDITGAGSKGRGQTWLDNESGRVEALGAARVEADIIRNTKGSVLFDESLIADTLHGQCDDCRGRHRAGSFTHRKVWQRSPAVPGTLPQILSGSNLTLKSQRLKSVGGLISASKHLSIRSDDIALDSGHLSQRVNEKHYRGNRVRATDFQQLLFKVDHYGVLTTKVPPSLFWPMDVGGAFRSAMVTPDRLLPTGEKNFEQGTPLLATTLQGGQFVSLNGKTLTAGLTLRSAKPDELGLTDSSASNAFQVQPFGGAAQYGSGRQSWTPGDLPGLHHLLSPAQDGQPWRFVSITPTARVRANSLAPISLPWMPYRRLADDAGDQLLVRSMITHATGMRFLSPDIASDDHQLRRLASHARVESQRLGLAPGMPLSAEQIQSLEKDILWYQTLELDGETLLAPALYLAKRPGGVNLLAGKTMNLELSSVEVGPSARLAAGQSLHVKSEHFKSEGHWRSGGDLAVASRTSLSQSGGTMAAGGQLGIASHSIHIDHKPWHERRGLSQQETVIPAWLTGTEGVTIAGNEILLEGTQVRGGRLDIRAGQLTMRPVATSREQSQSIRHGQSNERHISQLPTLIETSGTVAIKALSAVLQAIEISAPEIDIHAMELSLLTAYEETHRESHERRSNSWGSSKHTHQESQTVTALPVILKSTNGSRLTGKARLILEGTRIRGLAILNSDQPVQLLIASDQAMAVSQTRRDSLLWTSSRKKGQRHTAPNPPEFDRLELTGGALIQLDQQLLGSRPAPLNQTLMTLRQNPRLTWLAELSEQNDIQWQAVEMAHENWDHKSQGLTSLGAAVIAVAVGCVTAGYGTAMAGGLESAAASAAMDAGFSALVSTASVSLVNNKGNIGRTLEELGSKEHLETLAIATVTAAITQGMFDTGYRADPSAPVNQQLRDAIVRTTTKTTVSTVIEGGSMMDHWLDSLSYEGLEQVMAQGFYWAGDYAQEQQREAIARGDQTTAQLWQEGGALKTGLHAAVGALAGQIMSGKPWAGALAGASAEVISGIQPGAHDKLQEVAAVVVSTVSAHLAGTDPNLGARVGQAGHWYNRELHKKEAEILQRFMANANEEQQALWLAAACSRTQCSRGIPEDHPAYQTFLTLEQTGQVCIREVEA